MSDVEVDSAPGALAGPEGDEAMAVSGGSGIEGGGIEGGGIEGGGIEGGGDPGGNGSIAPDSFDAETDGAAGESGAAESGVAESGAAESAAPGKPGDRLKQLEAEGDAGADYLEELLDIADLDGDIDIFVENGRASLAIDGDGDGKARLQRLVGRDGHVLESLQELTRMAVQAVTGERTRLVLDIGGWREARRHEAAVSAERVISEVRAGASSVELEPMPAYQRKVVHDLVADAGLRSESAGVEPGRHVVVFAG